MIRRAGDDALALDVTVFIRNRDRLLAETSRFLAAILANPGTSAPLLNEHLSVDGTLFGGRAGRRATEVPALIEAKLGHCAACDSPGSVG